MKKCIKKARIQAEKEAEEKLLAEEADFNKNPKKEKKVKTTKLAKRGKKGVPLVHTLVAALFCIIWCLVAYICSSRKKDSVE